MDITDDENTYHTELIENLLNGNIPEEKVNTVVDYLLSDERWGKLLLNGLVKVMKDEESKDWN